MLGRIEARVSVKTKNQNPVTKISALLPGHIQQRRVRCGKANCKCARGSLHTAYYHAWDTDGVRYRQYVKRADVEAMRAACEAHKALQIQLREGRVAYKQLLARARALFAEG
jgi:hypothetical protein